MQVSSILDLKVLVLPSWMDELLRQERIQLEDACSYPKLYEHSMEGRVSKEELFAYIIINSEFDKKFGDVYSDLYKISQQPENLQFVVDHQASIDMYKAVQADEDIAKNISTSLKEGEDSIFKPGSGFFEKEHYIPKMVGTDTLYFIGARTKTFKDKRAFYNVLLEEVSRFKRFDEIKTTNFFKHYLRHAVDD